MLNHFEEVRSKHFAEGLHYYTVLYLQLERVTILYSETFYDVFPHSLSQVRIFLIMSLRSLNLQILEFNSN